MSSSLIVLAATQPRLMTNTIWCIYSKVTTWWWIVNLFETCRGWLL